MNGNGGSAGSTGSAGMPDVSSAIVSASSPTLSFQGLMTFFTSQLFVDNRCFSDNVSLVTNTCTVAGTEGSSDYLSTSLSNATLHLVP